MCTCLSWPCVRGGKTARELLPMFWWQVRSATAIPLGRDSVSATAIGTYKYWRLPLHQVDKAKESVMRERRRMIRETGRGSETESAKETATEITGVIARTRSAAVLEAAAALRKALIDPGNAAPRLHQALKSVTKLGRQGIAAERITQNKASSSTPHQWIINAQKTPWRMKALPLPLLSWLKTVKIRVLELIDRTYESENFGSETCLRAYPRRNSTLTSSFSEILRRLRSCRTRISHSLLMLSLDINWLAVLVELMIRLSRTRLR